MRGKETFAHIFSFLSFNFLRKKKKKEKKCDLPTLSHGRILMNFFFPWLTLSFKNNVVILSKCRDFNPEENVSDKFRKINEIKDGRGLRKFIKETLNASAGKTTHELIGSVEVPLRTVPSAGLDRWLPLEKPESSRRKQRGDIRVKIALSTEKDQNLTSQEHKHLLKILFANELQTSEVRFVRANQTTKLTTSGDVVVGVPLVVPTLVGRSSTVLIHLSEIASVSFPLPLSSLSRSSGTGPSAKSPSPSWPSTQSRAS